MARAGAFGSILSLKVSGEIRCFPSAVDANHIEEKQFPLRNSYWVDLSALLSTLCDEFEEAGALVRYNGPEHVRLFCRPNAITRAVTNLVDNGCEFGKSVVVRASVGDGVIIVEVEDDGPGIPAERLQEVVEPFVRLDPGRSGRPGSVGLGLSIVKEIVETHGRTFELLNRQPTGLLDSRVRRRRASVLRGRSNRSERMVPRAGLLALARHIRSKWSFCTERSTRLRHGS
jgi:hypothetical protein